MIHVYHRTFWKQNRKYPGGLEPHLGYKTTLAYVESETRARELCEDWNAANDPGRYSRKAEYERM